MLPLFFVFVFCVCFIISVKSIINLYSTVLYSQSCKLVHVSGIHCHVRASSTSGCAFVYFTVQYCIEYNGTVCLFQAQDV